MPILTIKEYVDATNLLTINWRRATLNAIAKEYKLKAGECVVFENVVHNKARIVAIFGANPATMPVLLIPPIDSKDQLSMHLEVNEFLREMAGVRRVRDVVQERCNTLAERIFNRQFLKEAAKKNRRKK